MGAFRGGGGSAPPQELKKKGKMVGWRGVGLWNRGKCNLCSDIITRGGGKLILGKQKKYDGNPPPALRLLNY